MPEDVSLSRRRCRRSGAADSDVFEEIFVPGKVSPGTRLELWMVQAKRDVSFTETAVEKVAHSAGRLLNLAEAESDLRQLYSPGLVTRTGFFRRALRALATRHPQVMIHFVYATRGRAFEWPPKG